MSDSEFVRRSNAGSPTALNKYETPEGEYSCGLKRREEQLATIRGLHQRLWTYLIVAGIAGLVVVYVTLSLRLIPSVWILLPVAMVLCILQALAKNARTHSTVQRILKFYELGVARLSQQWKGLGIDGKEFLPADHLYASDLDLFGSGSLFELLCTARTGIGRATLAKWLTAASMYSADRRVSVALQITFTITMGMAGKVKGLHRRKISRDETALSFPRARVRTLQWSTNDKRGNQAPARPPAKQ